MKNSYRNHTFQKLCWKGEQRIGHSLGEETGQRENFQQSELQSHVCVLAMVYEKPKLPVRARASHKEDNASPETR